MYRVNTQTRDYKELEAIEGNRGYSVVGNDGGPSEELVEHNVGSTVYYDRPQSTAQL
jgi:hypothetical protein